MPKQKHVFLAPPDPNGCIVVKTTISMITGFTPSGFIQGRERRFAIRGPGGFSGSLSNLYILVL